MKKTKIPGPLVAGAVIARRTITLGMGHEAIVTITYDGPNEPTPESGNQWPPEKDWPAARLVLELPTSSRLSRDNQFGLAPDLHAPEIKVLGDTVRIAGSYDWGWNETDSNTGNISASYRRKSFRRAGTSLRKLAADMLRETVAELRPLQAHVLARSKRLAQRDATLQAGLDIAPLKS